MIDDGERRHRARLTARQTCHVFFTAMETKYCSDLVNCNIEGFHPKRRFTDVRIADAHRQRI
jgi:hypothetical protein